MSFRTVSYRALFFLAMVLVAFAEANRGAAADVESASGAAALADHELFAVLSGESASPVKCLTPFIAEADRRGLQFVQAAAPGDTVVFSTTHFDIEYYTTGNHAIDPTDVDESGTPDYVEWVAEACEESWDAEVVNLGYEIDLGGGRYVVRLLDLSSYGWTDLRPGSPGGTRITVNGDFAGFYATHPTLTHDDPDGLVRGAIRVTVAHEWKHALQIAEGWNFYESSYWLETDATWIEDIVYDDVNDYYNYIRGPGSPFSDPTTSLIAASYEDATWQHYCSEKYGLEFVRDFSRRRGLAPGIAAQTIWLQTAQGNGVDWPELWRDYSTWTYLTGGRTHPGFGFGEAAGYPTATTDSIAGLPLDVPAGTLRVMAMRYYRFAPAASAAAGTLSVDFTGQIVSPWALTVVFQGPDSLAVVPVPIVGGVAQTTLDGYDVSDFDEVGVLVGNPRVSSSATEYQTYSLRLDLNAPAPIRSRSWSRLKGAYAPDTTSGNSP